MSLLYQSPLRREITEKIYKKPTFELKLEDTLYRGILKKQYKLGKELRWAMIHGVEFGDMGSFSPQFAEQLRLYTRDHTGWSDIFLQIGTNNMVDTSPSGENPYDLIIKEEITHLQRDLLQRYDLRPTVREHMPHATIILSTDGSHEKRCADCTVSGRRMIRKAEKAGLDFVIASPEDRIGFWQLRYSMSYDKGFSVIPQDQFLELMHFLTINHTGQLFLAKKEKEIVSGSLCLRIDDQLIYLYGATDRSFGHIGAHYRLTIQILGWAKELKYTSFDLFGIAPPGSGEDHPLAGVTRFKQSFGGRMVLYAGSYDLILNKRLYAIFKTLKGK